MTIEVHDRESGPYLANGSTKTFVFDFALQDGDHLAVERTIGEVSEIVNPSEYVVQLNPDQNLSPGGSFTFNTTPNVGTIIFPYSNAPYIQPTDLQQNQGYYVDSVEDSLDNLNIQTQQLAREVERSIRTARRGKALKPLPLPRPNVVIGLDENAEPVFIDRDSLGGGGGGGGCCTPFLNIDGGGAFTTDECMFLNINWNATDDCVGNTGGVVGPIQPPVIANPIIVNPSYSVFSGRDITEPAVSGIAFGAPGDPWGIYIYDETFDFVEGQPVRRPSPRRIGDWADSSTVEQTQPADYLFELLEGNPSAPTNGTTSFETTTFAGEVGARFAARLTTTRTIQQTASRTFLLRIRRASNNDILGQTVVTLTNSHEFSCLGQMTVSYNDGGLFEQDIAINSSGALVGNPNNGFFEFSGWTYSNAQNQIISSNNATVFPTAIPQSDLSLRPRQIGGLINFPSGLPVQFFNFIPAATGTFPIVGGEAGLKAIAEVPDGVTVFSRDFDALFDIVQISTQAVVGRCTMRMAVLRNNINGVAPPRPVGEPEWEIQPGENLGQLFIQSTVGGVVSVTIAANGDILLRQSNNANPSAPVLFRAWINGPFNPNEFEVRMTAVTGLNLSTVPANVWHPLASGDAEFGLEAATPPASQIRSGSATIQIRQISTGQVVAQYPFSALIQIGT